MPRDELSVSTSDSTAASAPDTWTGTAPETGSEPGTDIPAAPVPASPPPEAPTTLAAGVAAHGPPVAVPPTSEESDVVPATPKKGRFRADGTALFILLQSTAYDLTAELRAKAHNDLPEFAVLDEVSSTSPGIAILKDDLLAEAPYRLQRRMTRHGVGLHAMPSPSGSSAVVRFVLPGNDLPGALTKVSEFIGTAATETYALIFDASTSSVWSPAAWKSALR